MAPRIPRVPLGAIQAVWLVLLLAIAPASVYAAPFAAVVMDARTGQVLHSVNHTARLHPASLTKMMTLYVAFEAVQNGEISLDTRVRISQRAASEPPSRLGLRAGQQIALRHLIRAAALRSGNDAATAIAEAISGSVPAFADRMNRTALAMGMRSTHFHNAHGLTETGHLSTAQDMAILSRQLFFDFPQYYNIFSRRSEDAGIARVTNTNSRFLDHYRGADGIKTGFTNAAGYNLAAMAERDGVRILVVVFGGRSAADRHSRVVDLMDRGFREAPRRVAVRRPAAPNYSQVAATTGSIPAGRVIRLQTAPQRSPFPRPRPDPQVPEPLVASIQTDIATVLEQVVAPPMPAAANPETATPGDIALAAPERSPVPVPRPEAEADDPLIAARAAGFGTIEASDLDARLAAAAALEAEILEASMPPSDAENDRTDAMDAAPDTPSPPAQRPRMQQFTHDPAEIGRPIIADGVLVIPGLPPLLVDAAMPDAAPMNLPAGDLALTGPVLPEDLDTAPEALPVSEPLRVDATGQVLWRDEELLTAMVDMSDRPELGNVVLTASDTGSEPAPDLPPMPEIVTRASVLGGAVAGPGWAVSLGRYGTRSEAERILLRVALSEGSLLGAGQRQIAQRSGGFVALIGGLSGEQAELACLRLAARAQGCDVISP